MLDIKTGKLRPREYVAPQFGGAPAQTVYARVDYLDPRIKLSPQRTASLKTILKNLPVVFTYAPMSLLSYHVSFPPNSTQVVRVRYTQSAFSDTRAPASHQVAYVLHPASKWKDFGPINLKVTVPQGVELHASVPVKRSGSERSADVTYAVYRSTVRQKTGELYLAVSAEDWAKATAPKKQAALP